METQNISNLLNTSENEFSKFATRKWYVIESESKGKYLHHKSIRFLTKSIESYLCNCSDAYILVAGDITVKSASNANLTAAARIFLIFLNSW